MSYMDDLACLAQVFAAEGPSHTPQSNAPGHNPAPAKTISSQVSNMEALQIAPALLTRTADEVIADLKRGHARPPRKERKAEEVLEQAKGTGHTNNNVREEKVEGEGDDAMEDSDAEDVLVEQPRIQKAPERQRVNKANFNSYFDKFARQKAKSQTIVEGSHLEKLSVKALVRQAESQRIIASPRDYQQELFEKAKERNIIAVMDTGSGKTLIAVLLLRHIMEQELEDRAAGKSKRISFFLVDSVQLIFQQFAVLECNLDQPMAYICGQMGCDLWSRDLWQKYVSENMILVCTAEVLRHALHLSHISMDQINLLVFDEAHHAKKDHPYARIIKDFYVDADRSTRPQIFGMTASPVDANVDVKQAAAELEAILHSQIVTTADPSQLQHFQKAQQDVVGHYPTLQMPFETPLYQRLKARLQYNDVFRRVLDFARQATSELGPWCADQVFRLSFEDEEMRRLEAKTERKFAANKLKDVRDIDTHLIQLREAKKVVDEYQFTEPQPTTEFISGKVLRLRELLLERFEFETDAKCIVFATQRYTVRLLEELFKHKSMGTEFLHPGALVGGRQSDVGDLKSSHREQVLTMMKFRKGQLNCLFATSVAEEGLDIPDCNLVIRFDLYRTLIQYIQSRGRARLQNSKYVHMLERGNREHDLRVREVKRNEDILRRFCQALPADRLLSTDNVNIDDLLKQERVQRIYREPSTGATLNYKMALVLLANFTTSLPSGGEAPQSPEYFVMSQSKQFLCEVILPESSPIRGAIGRQATSKSIARCSAAFEACLTLRHGGYLDANFQSTFAKQLPAMRNAHLAISSKTQSAYAYRPKPEFWQPGTTPELLYMTALTLTDPSCLDRPYQPLGLLSRTAMPKMPDVDLHFGKHRRSGVRSTTFKVPLHLNPENLAKVNAFTLRIFDDIFSKSFENDPSKVPYFLVPLRSTQLFARIEEPNELVDWDLLTFVETTEQLSWDDSTPDNFFVDRYIVDIWDGSRKLFLQGVAPQYKPLDPVPPNTAPRPPRKRTDNIMEYSISLFAKARERRTFRENQRVFKANVVPRRRDLLDDTEVVESSVPTECYVIMEPLKISALPSKVVATAYLFPFIIHRIESFLIALEACHILHLDIRPDLALEALTKDSDNTEEHGQEQINFQRGMGNNYERLEFLGDCFLKMATSISLYTQHATDDEQSLHVKRMLMICNQNIFNVAVKLQLYEYVRSISFSQDPRAWYPRDLNLAGKGKKLRHTTSHNLAKKTIADVGEALIGASLLTQYDTKRCDLAVRAVTELVCSTDHTQTSFKDYYAAYQMPKYLLVPATAGQINLAKQIGDRLGYHFKHPRLLRSAFIHPSYPFIYERIPSYQRLEFLGDSLLDMACINFLFHTWPGKDPQWLTEHKMAMVSNQFLGLLCVELGFHRHLLAFNSGLQRQITEYVVEIEEARREAQQDAVRAGGKEDDFARDFWVHTTLPPKCLPDIVEAYVGAVFVDSCYSFSEVEKFFDKHIKHYFIDISIYDTFANKHPVTFLSNFLGNRMGCDNWNVLAKQLPDVGDGMPPLVLATVIVHGVVVEAQQGTSSKYAKKGVAEKALEGLVGLTPAEFRGRFGCDCKVRRVEEEVDGEGKDVDPEGEQ